jgi:hypothetical protein
MTTPIKRTHVVQGLISEYRRAALQAQKIPAQKRCVSFGTPHPEEPFAAEDLRTAFEAAGITVVTGVQITAARRRAATAWRRPPRGRAGPLGLVAMLQEAREVRALTRPGDRPKPFA